MSRPYRPRTRRHCLECGISTQSALSICAKCLARGVEPLTDGRWVNVRGIQRWQPDGAA